MLGLPAAARPLKGLCEGFEPLRKLGDLPYVKPVVGVKPEAPGVKPQDVVFTIAAKAGPIKVSPAPDGSIAFPLTDALCAENPEITNNQPDNTVALSVTIDPQVPPARELQYGQLEELRRQWDVAISRQNLLYRMMAPSAKGYQLSFEPGRAVTAEVRLPQGPKRFTADAQGQLHIPIESSWASLNPLVVLSEMPRRVGLRFKG